MTEQEINTFIPLHNKIGNEAYELYDYIKSKYGNELEMNRSYYESYELFNGMPFNKDSICITYRQITHKQDGNDKKKVIEIPVADFIKRPHEWADEWAALQIEDNKQKKLKKQREIEKRELAQLRRLKKKYEK